MKKIFTLALSAFLLGGVNLFAQEEDMTKYIVNAGFDEDLTFQKDGTMKEAVTTTTSLGERSWAYIAADSTVYARPKSTSSQNRADGRKLEAVNGFKGRVSGWTLESNADFPKCEWTYFGTVPYDLANQSVPIADDGATYLEVPERPTEFDGGEGFVYLRAGWTNSAIYKQVVKLPCAVYRLVYWTININPSTSAVAKDLTQIVCRREVFKDEEGTGLQNTTWTKHEFEFTPTAEFTMQFGYEAANAGSGGQPIVALDGIKLYKIDDADPIDVLQADINDLGDEIFEALNVPPYTDFGGIYEQVNALVDKADDLAKKEDQAGLEALLKELTALQALINGDLKDVVEEYNTLNGQIDGLLNLDYPGADDLEKTADEIDSKIGDATAEGIIAAVEQLKEAINKYNMSQPASEDNPADYTFLVTNPYFTTAAAQPTIIYKADGSIESITYPNADTYTVGSAPASTDATSEGWYKAGTTAGDQRLNYVADRVCWNAWRTNAEDVAVAQDLTDLPNGYYKVSAELITQADYVSNQHVFASSSVQDVESPALTSGDWDAGTWTYLTTEKVLVVDGKLTIGALGSAKDGSTDQTGWFCVTNFKLNYLGEASEEAVAAAIANRFAEAQAMADTMHLAADKATFNAAIAAAKATNDLDSLAAALTIAKASEAEYAGIIAGTYGALQDSIANNQNYSADAVALVKVPVQYMTDYLGSAEATYTKTGDITTVLRYYRDTLIPALQAAEAAKAAAKNENGKNIIAANIEKVKTDLNAYVSSTTKLDAATESLKKAIAAAEQADIEFADGADVTAYINNPTVDDANANGWTFVKVAGGNATGNGQQVDGAAGYYLDTYKSGGGLRATWYQVLNVPNGTYTLKNIMRAPGTGAYLFASDKAPVTENDSVALDPTANTKLALATNVQTNLTKYIDPELKNEAGNDSISTAADAYGEIYMAAIDAYIAKGYGSYATTTDEGPLSAANAISDAASGESVPGLEAEWAIINANDGLGRGWFHNAIESFEVTDHVLVIGVTCDYAFLNKTAEEAYDGDWFSADNFTLTLDKAGNNEGWDPTTGIANVETAPAASAAYNVAGQRVSDSYKGIVIKNGKKYLVK